MAVLTARHFENDESFEDSNRPKKKRRFFVDDPEDTPPPDEPHVDEPEADQKSDKCNDDLAESHTETIGFDASTLEAFVGEKLSEDVVLKLKDMSGENIERAINIYLDGSWKANSPAPRTNSIKAFTSGAASQKKPIQFESPGPPPGKTQITPEKIKLDHMPAKRYVGAFGVVGWATRSGTGLIKHEEKVRLERVRMASTKPGRGGKVIQLRRKDNVVRFTNARKEEIGRLESESAEWVAPLLDQNLCELEGHCVFAPESIRSNDTIYLQVRCYFKKSAFDAGSFIKPVESNRQTGIFESKETSEERDLHLRQMALVKLFNEINLQPSRSNATTEKHKRQGLLKATEVAEHFDPKDASKAGKAEGEPGSSPPSEEAEEGEELQQDQLDTLYSKAQTFDFSTPEYQPASTFAMTLRKYQKQALHWMIGKEKDEKGDGKETSMHPLWEEYTWPSKDVEDRDLPVVADQQSFYVNPYSGELSLQFPVQEQHCLGGILADEMGLGKTIEMLSLIHSHKSDVAERIAGDDKPMSINDLPRLPQRQLQVGFAPVTTLVVAPMSLLAQWQSEAEKASQAGSMKVLMYYGAEKSINLANMCSEANAAKAPNVIITSYGTVLSEYTQITSGSGDRTTPGGLFAVEYFRIILDEAHHIKNRQSKTAKACYELAARHRWVLTGTPIVNRLEDLFSLVHFLRVEPWSNFSFWKTFITVPFEAGDYVKALDVVQTVLEPLVLRRTKDMKTPDGEALVPLPPRKIEILDVELSKDEREVYNLIFARAKRTFASNVEAGTLLKSYTTIFAQILRLRQSCDHPLLTRNKNVTTDDEEAAAAADIANGLADDMDLQSLIERFSTQESEEDANKFGAHALQQIQEEAENECPICSEEPMIEQTVTGCWHSACKKCLTDYIEHQQNKGELPRCFNCREPINSRDTFEVVRHDDDDDRDKDFFPSVSTDGTGDEEKAQDGTTAAAKSTPKITLRRCNQPSSAKVTALLAQLKTLRKDQPGAKSVIFSQFTSFLDLLEPVLSGARIPFLRFDGTMAQKQRAAVLARFCDDSGSSKTRGAVLLLSLRAGGVGLNLTTASTVFMMDPWWSWAVEAQAIDRVHRMGQEKPVRVVRFVCRESIEEKMLRIQERKKFIAGSLGMMSEEERRVQRIEDIRELLS